MGKKESLKVIYEDVMRDGKKLVIRYPAASDAVAMWKYINAISKEKTYTRFQGEEISLEIEKEFLKSQLDRISKYQSVLLLAFIGRDLIGITGIEMKDMTERHVGTLGISVAKNFRGKKIGSLLMKLVEAEAAKRLSDLKIITLEVFNNNEVGKKMYKKYGYAEYGKLPSGIKLDDGCVDQVLMYKQTGML